MKVILGFLLVSALMLPGCGDTVLQDGAVLEPGTETVQPGMESENDNGGLIVEESDTESGVETQMPRLNITINGTSFSAVLADNPTARALLAELPLELTMQELHGNEKYYNLPHSLPADAEAVGNIQAGDIMLWQDNCLVVFYQSFATSYSYTKIGQIEDVDGLAAAVGSGNVTIKFELSE